MSYTKEDFQESMRISGVELSDVDVVLQGWGNIDAEGACCEECGGEWSGGFVFQMKDGRIGRVTGWCDYTGWGCQDGADVEWLDAEPEAGPGVDLMPADLNGESLAQMRSDAV